ncbi:hypothetical protein Dda_7025 [Drechslerella dactyloides]|uniref:Uncharacterized protein n=1 Tax=Drechslerella dactyloides TaxID=74499 RepID=A0AAD6IT03_DREDA|nr:hypothetical protein Dda_7025 [Drechslerella dactyloides]
MVLGSVEDMANQLLSTRSNDSTRRVGKRWASNFVKRRPELQTRLSRRYDYQRAKCEDPALISKWFQLIEAVKAKYGIADNDVYNFDETGFAMGIISTTTVVTGAEARDKAKLAQPGNREWATVIQGIGAEGWAVPPFIILAGHAALPFRLPAISPRWSRKPPFSRLRAVLHKIVTICMPPHSSHILQPLDIGCFGPLKQAYSKEVESLMRAHVNHISKLEFLSGFHKAFTAAMTPKNIRSSFAGAGIVPYDPERVLSKLDMQLPAATPVNSRPGTANAAATWTTKTPLNPSEASLQAGLIKNQITQYQNTSPTSLLAAVDQLSKGAQTIMHQMALIRAENTMLRSANEVLNKRRRLKRQRIQHGGTLTIHQADRILDGDATDEVVERPAPPKRQRTPQPEATSGNTRRCGKCGSVEDMANQLLSTRSNDSTRRVGKRWASNFVKRRPELQTRLSRRYDYQRAKCEDPALISKWFQLIEAVKAKYGIADNDVYNFDETGFAMGIISTTTVVTGAEARDKAKLAQPGNREWATVIQGIGAEGWAVPPFIILAGHAALPFRLPAISPRWSRKPPFSRLRAVLHKIVTICMPPHSSHILQPLDIGCFGPLKQAYSKEVESLMRAHVNHISKLEFLSGFHKAFTAAMTPKNIRSSFAGAGIVPYDPERVLSKLDMQLPAATPVNSRPGTANAAATWTTKTPLNPSEASLQAGLIKNQITQYQNTSPTSLLAAVDQLSKGAQTIMHQMALIRAENTMLRSANEVLNKRRRLKRQRIQHGGTLTIHQADRILDGDATDEVVERPAPPKRQRTPQPEATSGNTRRCGKCGKHGHNIRTCQQESSGSELTTAAAANYPSRGSLWLGVAPMVWTPYLLTLPTYSIIVQDFTSLVYAVNALWNPERNSSLLIWLTCARIKSSTWRLYACFNGPKHPMSNG